jgi:hypothetical protein
MRTVPRANDLTFRHFRTLQGLAVVCTTVFYCVELLPTAYDKQGESVDIRGEGFLIRERVGGTDIDPLGAQNIPVCRRAASDIML